MAAERARVATEGWGARLLALRDPDGQWAGGACFPAAGWRVRRGRPAVDVDAAQPGAAPRLRSGPRLGLGAGDGGAGPGELPLGVRRRALLRRRGRALHQRPDRRARRLLRRGRRRGSSSGCSANSSTTAGGTARRRTARPGRRSTRPINVLEGLLEYERATGGAAPRPRRPGAAARSTCSNGPCSGARARARSSSPPSWTFSFPPQWHYDVLRALEYFRLAGGSAGRAPGRGGRAGARQAAARRDVVAGEHPPRRGALRAGGRRRSAEPLEHAPGAARAAVVRGIAWLNGPLAVPSRLSCVRAPRSPREDPACRWRRAGAARRRRRRRQGR